MTFTNLTSEIIADLKTIAAYHMQNDNNGSGWKDLNDCIAAGHKMETAKARVANFIKPTVAETFVFNEFGYSLDETVGYEIYNLYNLYTPSLN